MSVRIFHTGDIHVGIKFSNYPDEVREQLQEARHLVLENMIKQANELRADIFVVAGDLFNTIKISKKDIKRTVTAINEFAGHCFLVLPGNHDYDNGAIELWTEFKEGAGEHVLFLNEERTFDLSNFGLDVKVFPAPCHSKHSKENALGWMKIEDMNPAGEGFNIGIAHGALEGLSPDLAGNYYYMSMDELDKIPVDLWLLGHTHVSWPEKAEVHNHRIFNCGSPEADGLDFKREASAWLIDLDKGGVGAEKVYTGKYSFYDKDFAVKRAEDLGAVRNWALGEDPKSKTKAQNKIIRLNLSGHLPKEDYDSLSTFYMELESQLLYLIVRDSGLKIRIDREIIEKEFAQGSFPYELLSNLQQDEEALQIAYELLRRGSDGN